MRGIPDLAMEAGGILYNGTGGIGFVIRDGVGTSVACFYTALSSLQVLSRLRDFGKSSAGAKKVGRFRSLLLFIDKLLSHPPAFDRHPRSRLARLVLVVGWGGGRHRSSPVGFEYTHSSSWLDAGIYRFTLRSYCWSTKNHGQLSYTPIL